MVIHFGMTGSFAVKSSGGDISAPSFKEFKVDNRVAGRRSTVWSWSSTLGHQSPSSISEKCVLAYDALRNNPSQWIHTHRSSLQFGKVSIYENAAGNVECLPPLRPLAPDALEGRAGSAHYSRRSALLDGRSKPCCSTSTPCVLGWKLAR